MSWYSDLPVLGSLQDLVDGLQTVDQQNLSFFFCSLGILICGYIIIRVYRWFWNAQPNNKAGTKIYLNHTWWLGDSVHIESYIPVASISATDQGEDIDLNCEDRYMIQPPGHYPDGTGLIVASLVVLKIATWMWWTVLFPRLLAILYQAIWVQRLSVLWHLGGMSAPLVWYIFTK